MTWVKLDDGFFRHPKARAVGKDGRALFLASCCFAAANLTDGFIPDHALPLLAAEAEVRPSVASRLVDHGLWDQAVGGYFVHDYLDRNPPRAKVVAQREAKAAAGRKGAAARWQDDGKPHGTVPSLPHSSGMDTDMPPSPSPLGSISSSSSSPLTRLPDDEDVETILRLYADQKLAAAGGTVRNPKPWRARVLENARAEGRDVEAARLFATYDVTHAQVAAALVAEAVPPSWGTCRRKGKDAMSGEAS